MVSSSSPRAPRMITMPELARSCSSSSEAFAATMRRSGLRTAAPRAGMSTISTYGWNSSPRHFPIRATDARMYESCCSSQAWPLLADSSPMMRFRIWVSMGFRMRSTSVASLRQRSFPTASQMSPKHSHVLPWRSWYWKASSGVSTGGTGACSIALMSGTKAWYMFPNAAWQQLAMQPTAVVAWLLTHTGVVTPFLSASRLRSCSKRGAACGSSVSTSQRLGLQKLMSAADARLWSRGAPLFIAVSWAPSAGRMMLPYTACTVGSLFA
mmetsp:Transcript_2910/g.8405  ORF Transcript_2910/g.8405 Transcript_2910/m.8405 type:complete len:268 (+) Transcript_2910:1541-2344(+)